MKKISLILFSIILMFGFIFEIKAEDRIPGTLGDVTSYPAVDVDSSKKKNRVPYANYSSTFAGVRISFVDGNGNLITHRDYANYTIKRYSTIFATNSNYAKTVYAKGVRPMFAARDLSKASLYSSFSSLETILKTYHFDTPNFSSKIKSIEQIDLGMFEDLFAEENHNNSYDYATDLIGILSSFGLQSYLNDEDIKNLFMVVEPTSIWLLDERPYYGTAYELASQARYFSPDGCTSSGTALCNFDSVIRKNLACSATLEGNLLNKVSQEVSSFASGKYFGTINILSNVDYICSSSSTDAAHKFTYQETYGYNGIAMGAVWFYDYWKPQTINCSIIQQYANDYNKYMCTDILGMKDVVSKYNENKPAGYASITLSDYKNYCGCKNLTSATCDPITTVNQCIGEDIVSVHYQDGTNDVDSNYGDDSSFWESCVYQEGGYTINPHKYSDNSMDLTYYEEDLGDKDYCPVYCIEKVEASYDYRIPEVNSGFHFIWPEQDLTEVSGRRVCSVQKRTSKYNGKTVYVDFDMYLNDLKVANERVQKAYLAYLLEIEREKEFNSAIYRDEKSSTCDCKYNTAHFSCCSSEEWVEGYYYDCGYDSTTGEYTDRCYSEGYYECTDKNDDRWPMYDAKTATATVYSGKFGTKRDSDEPDWCTNESKPVIDVNSKYQAYLHAIENVKNIVQRMQKCYTWDADTVYNLDSEATLIYDDGANYEIEKELDKEVEEDSGLIEDEFEYECESNNQTYIFKCTGQKNGNCNEVKGTYDGLNIEVDKCNRVKMRRETTLSYYLPDGIFDYVMKDTNKSIHSDEYITSLYGYNDFINIGYSNLPVSYAAESGEGTLKIEYKKLGHYTTSYDEEKTMVDYILSNYSETRADYGTWSCGFNVYDELIDEKEINVIFRPIDLTNPFPDITAGGRTTGSNWCDEDYCGTDSKNSLVTSIITDKTDIYSREPMYVFNLTPATIMKIRSYNKQQSTTDEGYSDFYLDCETATGNACISDFVSNLISGVYGNAYPSGKCTESIYRISKSETFYQCKN